MAVSITSASVPGGDDGGNGGGRSLEARGGLDAHAPEPAPCGEQDRPDRDHDDAQDHQAPSWHAEPELNAAHSSMWPLAVPTSEKEPRVPGLGRTSTHC